MRLSKFIRTNLEPILLEWEAFARTYVPAGSGMNVEALRDHAAAMLEVIAVDLESTQTSREQFDKSQGQAAAAPETKDTAAEEHGHDRAESGFSLSEMVSEYRALRASVIRLWTKEQGGHLAGSDIDELTRFNEAIDQALAESTVRFSENLSRLREMFLGVLGHDLRSPLGSIIAGASFLADEGKLAGPNNELVRRIGNSGRRMSKLIDELLDLTRSRLGSGIPIKREDMDLEQAAKDAISEVVSFSPDARVEFTATGDLRGNWDSARLSQVLSNLINNAVQYGGEHGAVTVTLEGKQSEVQMRVHNLGPPIHPDAIARIFEPFKNTSTDANPEPRSGLGLGLYIAKQIVDAHKGDVSVASDAERGTTFTVRLPRD